MTNTATIHQSYLCCFTCGYISDDEQEVRAHILETGHTNKPPVEEPLAVAEPIETTEEEDLDTD